MTIKELREKLLEFPQDAVVSMGQNQKECADVSNFVYYSAEGVVVVVPDEPKEKPKGRN